MSHRINVILDDDIWESLQAVPKGERSPLVSGDCRLARPEESPRRDGGDECTTQASSTGRRCGEGLDARRPRSASEDRRPRRFSVAQTGAACRTGDALSSKHSPAGDAFVAVRYRLLLPSLGIYEAGNVLAIKRPPLAVEALNLLVFFEFALAEPDEACRNKTFELTERFGVSCYDAAYHAVATVEPQCVRYG